MDGGRQERFLIFLYKYYFAMVGTKGPFKRAIILLWV
jgi:hypothetical protein